MEPRLQRRVQRYGWDRAADTYEAGWASQLAPAQAALLERADLRPGQRVLDVACGTGLVALPAARAVGPTGSVCAVDLSDEMVARLRASAERAGVRNLSVARMDAEELRLPAASFDTLLNALGLMYLPDPARALSSAREVLRPGGRIVVAVWGPRSSCGWAEVFPIVDRRVRSEVCPLFFQLGTGDALGALLRRAGFDAVRTDRLETTLRYASPREAVQAALDAGPVALACSRFDAPTRAAVEREYLASLAPYRSGAGYELPGSFVVAEAVRPG